MSRKSKNPNRSAAQLRSIMRNYRLRIRWGIGLAAVSGSGVLACWHFGAGNFWWALSILAVVSALITIFADLNAYKDTKQRVLQIEQEISSVGTSED